jgi:phage terminase large subunit GpA-like protein
MQTAPKKHYKITSLPWWMPPGVVQQVAAEGRVRMTYRWGRPERKIMRKQKPVKVSAWAQRHRVLTMSSLPGPWRNDVTPYLAGIMDAAGMPGIETVIVCKSPQTGVSEAAHNYIAYTVDRAPGPVLYVYPDEMTAQENSRDRIQPMFRSSSRLRSYLTGVQDDVGVMRISLRHMPLYLAWSSSASRLGNKPIRYVIFDETDKYQTIKKEADPISLGEKRTITYTWGRKIWKISTPTTRGGQIWTALTTEAQAIFDYRVRCPQCSLLQLMEFERIKWPADERDPEKIEAKKLAWYECSGCGARLDDFDRDRAVSIGHWCERVSGTELFAWIGQNRPKKIGFHLPAWISPFISLSAAASAFLKTLKKYNPVNWLDKLKDFKNNYCAEPWVEELRERDTDRVLRLRDERPRGLVPGGGQVVGLVAGVDTQDDCFWYEIRAFGYGLAMESWGIREGRIDSLDALAAILWDDEYKDADGIAYPVLFTLQDAMGHRTSEVYDFCRAHRGRILPSQGVQTMPVPYKYSTLETYPRTNKAIPGGLKLARLNVNYYKNILAGKIEIEPTDPGAWHLHSEATTEWAAHMVAEYRDDDGKWICPENKANHGWDCSVLALAAADIIGLKHRKRKENTVEKKQPPAVNPYTRGRQLFGSGA